MALAGYYNHLKRNGYEPIAKALKARGWGLSFTCIEMADDENPDNRHTSPEGEHRCTAAGAQSLKVRQELVWTVIRDSLFLFKGSNKPQSTYLWARSAVDTCQARAKTAVGFFLGADVEDVNARKILEQTGMPIHSMESLGLP